MIKLFFEAAYLQGKWEHNVLLEIAPDGRIAHIDKDSACGEADKYSGFAIPGMVNVHSHAFQRAMAGLGEVAGPSDDSFWSWRKIMYQFLEAISPEDLQAIADQLYMEMLKAGFTGVGEFHYLHHQATGAPYSDPIEMGRRLAASAEKTGINLTLLPVLYSYGGFGSEPPTDGQRRFLQNEDAYLDMISALKSANFGNAVTIGMAPHSLRAVAGEQLDRLSEMLEPHMPMHIHIAEQEKEVADCLAWSGERPVEHLLRSQPVDHRWCLIHATHVTLEEIDLIVKSGATVGLCPVTEANLGDGIFPAEALIEGNGFWGVGTDSNVSISYADECRILEYGHRLSRQKRTLIAQRGESNGTTLFDQSLVGGSRALYPSEVSGLRVGARADIVVLDSEHPNLVGRKKESIFDSWIFSGGNDVVKDVFVRGTKVISNGRHQQETEIRQQFGKTMLRLLQRV